MATTIRGVIKNGIVEPLEPLMDSDGTEVTITLPEKIVGYEAARRIYFGMFKHWGEFNEEDFKSSEWHGNPDDGLDWTGCWAV